MIMSVYKGQNTEIACFELYFPLYTDSKGTLLTRFIIPLEYNVPFSPQKTKRVDRLEKLYKKSGAPLHN